MSDSITSKSPCKSPYIAPSKINPHINEPSIYALITAMIPAVLTWFVLPSPLPDFLKFGAGHTTPAFTLSLCINHLCYNIDVNHGSERTEIIFDNTNGIY